MLVMSRSQITVLPEQHEYINFILIMTYYIYIGYTIFNLAIHTYYLFSHEILGANINNKISNVCMYMIHKHFMLSSRNSSIIYMYFLPVAQYMGNILVMLLARFQIYRNVHTYVHVHIKCTFCRYTSRSPLLKAFQIVKSPIRIENVSYIIHLKVACFTYTIREFKLFISALDKLLSNGN